MMMRENASLLHKPGLALRSRPHAIFRRSVPFGRIAMIPLSTAALANTRKPGFSAFISPVVKMPTGNSADHKQTAAENPQRGVNAACVKAALKRRYELR